MKIDGPGFGEIQRISTRDGAYYWSACAQVVVDHALLSRQRFEVLSAGNHKRKLRIVLRDAMWGPSQGNEISLVEGPLHVTALEQLGVRANVRRSRSLEVRLTRSNKLFKLAYRRNLVRQIAPKIVEPPPEPYPAVPEVPLFNPPPVRYQIFSQWPERFTPFLLAVSVDGESVVALASESEILLGFPLFDVGAQNLTVEPFRHGYYSSQDGCRVDDLVSTLLRVLSEGSAKAEGSGSRISQGPISDASKRSLTIRHDLDRPIPTERIDRLLSAYRALGLKSTWSIQTHVVPPIEQVEMILNSGHEINLHSCAESQLEFESELKTLEALYSIPLAGFTSHGGKGSAGNLGSKTNTWALLAGLDYGEIGGGHRANFVPFIRIEGGIPVPTSLMIPPAHFSFDRSMRDGDHYGEDLLVSISEWLEHGGSAVLMNHPDIHTNAFLELLEKLPLASVIPMTLREAASYYARRYA